MKRLVTALALTAFAAPGATVRAQDHPVGLDALSSTPITVGKRVSFRSEILETEVSMSIHVPKSFDLASDDHTYPVIFANGSHGRNFFATLVGIVEHLGDRERIPESIVVSLDDAGAIPDVYTNGMWAAEKIGGDPHPSKSLRHLEEEVFPYLRETYRANDYRLIIGVSGSSLFPIYTFLEAPALFESHILIAAADMIGMGFEPKQTFIEAFETAMREAPDRTAKLYVGSSDDDLEKRDDYAANLDALSKRLGGSSRLDLEVEIVPNTDHYEVFIRSVLSALDQNFPKDAWSARYRDLVAQPGDALANLDRYYAALSQRYGFRILPRADRWNSVNSLRFLIRHLIREGRPEEAVAVAQRRIEYRPRAARSYSGLADALEADAQPEGAVKALEKAMALARASGETTSDLEARLKGLRAGMAGATDP